MKDEGIYEYVAIDRRNQNEKSRIHASVSNRNKLAPKSSIVNKEIMDQVKTSIDSTSKWRY